LEQDHVAIHLVEEILEEEGMGGEELIVLSRPEDRETLYWKKGDPWNDQV
jgi:hypothetical protein